MIRFPLPFFTLSDSPWFNLAWRLMTQCSRYAIITLNVSDVSVRSKYAENVVFLLIIFRSALMFLDLFTACFKIYLSAFPSHLHLRYVFLQ